MAKSTYVYVSYIRTTPEKLWSALTDPKFIEQYWFGMRAESAFTAGSPWRLVSGDGTVWDAGEIVEATGLSQSNVSNHLSCLRDCGLVVAEPEGRFVTYRLSDDRVGDLIAIAESLLADVARGSGYLPFPSSSQWQYETCPGRNTPSGSRILQPPPSPHFLTSK